MEQRPRIGELLGIIGLVSSADVSTALGRQANEGARLGTCLLDLGLVDEASLLAALGAQQAIGAVDAMALAALPLDAASLLPARAAVRALAVPLDGTSTRLEVAMMDPCSLALVDELTAVCGRRILPRLGLEIRIQETLERLYGVEVSGRLARTRARLVKRAALPQASARNAPDAA